MALLLSLATPAVATIVEFSATEAIADEWSIFPGGHAFWIKELASSSETSAERKYLFDGTPTFSVNNNDTPGIITDDTIAFHGSIVNAVNDSRGPLDSRDDSLISRFVPSKFRALSTW